MSNRISYQEELSHAEENILIDGLTEGAKAHGLTLYQSFGFLIRDENDVVLGGITGGSYYGCFYIDILWVAKNLRGQGKGTELVQAAEALAKKRGCRFVSLTTMSFEALPFYQKLGYEIEYVREGFEKNQKMFVLRKNLTLAHVA